MKKTLALLLALMLVFGVMLPSAAFAANYQFTIEITGPDKDGAAKTVSRTSHTCDGTTPLMDEVFQMLTDGYEGFGAEKDADQRYDATGQYKQSGYLDLYDAFAGTGFGETVRLGIEVYSEHPEEWGAYCEVYAVTIVSSSENFAKKARTAEVADLTVADLIHAANNDKTVITFGDYTVTLALSEKSGGSGSGSDAGGTGTGGGGGGGGGAGGTDNPPDNPPVTPSDEITIALDKPLETEDYVVTPVVKEGETSAKDAKIALAEGALSHAKGNGKGDKVLVSVPVNGDGNVVMEVDPALSAGDPIEYAVVKDGYAYVLVDSDNEIYLEKRVDLFPDTFNHWSKNDVDFTAGREIFKGVSETEQIFAPDTTLTRGMLVTVLYRLESASAEGIANKFDDVQAGIWYADAVNWAAESGIVMGVGEGKFAPDQEINREEIATMLYRYAQKCGYALSGDAVVTFTDEAAISDWAQEAVQALVKAGVLNGKETGAYDPMAGATRGEASAILARFIKNVIG